MPKFRMELLVFLVFVVGGKGIEANVRPTEGRPNVRWNTLFAGSPTTKTKKHLELHSNFWHFWQVSGLTRKANGGGTAQKL